MPHPTFPPSRQRVMYPAVTLAAIALLACGPPRGGDGSSPNPPTTSTDQRDTMAQPPARPFDSQGHRGARGLLPENSIAGAELAVAHGMTTVELDLAVSRDRQLVVSHEPHFNPTICELDGTGYDDRTSLYTLDYADIARVDCGRKGHPEYPTQRRQPSPKPTLAALVTAADAKARSLGRPLPAYNIELKSDPELDEAYTPSPADFVDLVVAEVDRLGIGDRSNIQSFDPRPLRLLRAKRPDLRIAYLVGVPRSLANVEQDLGFRPDIYSPHHLTLTSAQIEAYHRAGVAVIPWTVNDVTRMRTLLAWGVDGMISDYPDRLAGVLASAGIAR